MIVVNEMEKKAYSEKKIEKNPWLLDDEKPVTDTKVTVPPELLCPICKELLKDAVMMPCCAGIIEPCYLSIMIICFFFQVLPVTNVAGMESLRVKEANVPCVEKSPILKS